MDKKNILNITNGDYFNKYFIEKFGGVAVAFCEAMMDGDTVENIYSAQFIKARCAALGVSEDTYKSKMHAYSALQKEGWEEIRLWFGKDTFCQANLLTVLAYLEQICFDGRVSVQYIDDETFALIGAPIVVQLGIYRKIYEEIFIRKQIPNQTGALIVNALRLYLDYHDKNGALVRLVRENADMEKTALMRLLMENTKDYGLSNLQAEKLIKENGYGRSGSGADMG